MDIFANVNDKDVKLSVTYKRGHYTAQITSKTENKRIGKEYFYSLCPCTYVVDWKHDSCHSDKVEYTDIKELVKAIAEKYK